MPPSRVHLRYFAMVATRRRFLSGLAMLALLLTPLAAKADLGWPRLPTDAEIEQMKRDLYKACVQEVEPEPGNIVSYVVLKRHDESILRNPEVLKNRGRSLGETPLPAAASALSIVVYVYWKIRGGNRYHIAECQSGRVKVRVRSFRCAATTT